jgi:hypothetical protein
MKTALKSIIGLFLAFSLLPPVLYTMYNWVWAQQFGTQPAHPLPAFPPQAAVGLEYIQSIVSSQKNDSSVRIEAASIGQSQAGAAIVLVTITNPNASKSARGGVMAVASQHGDEPAASYAMLELVRRFAHDEDQDMSKLLGDEVLRIVPYANPDGLDRLIRKTAGGIDMNRDWLRQTSAETKAIAEVIEEYRPDVLLDLHELVPRDRDRQHIIGRPYPKSSQLLAFLRNYYNERGIKLITIDRERHTGNMLLHRYFPMKYNRPALLVESKYTRHISESLQQRMDFQLYAVEGTLKWLNRIKI